MTPVDLSFCGLSGEGSHDLFSDRFYYRIGDKGYTFPDWSRMGDEQRENYLAYLLNLEKQHKALAGIPPMDLGNALGDMLGVEPYKVNDYRDMELKAKTKAKDIRDMTMSEYGQLRKSLGMDTNEYSRGLFQSEANYGVSLNTGTGAPVVLKPATKTKFDKWQEAREKFIKGEVDIEEVLKYVESDEDGYSRLVDEEIAEERAASVTVAVPKHRINWRRWPLWRWLAPWLYRGDLGRRRNR